MEARNTGQGVDSTEKTVEERKCSGVQKSREKASFSANLYRISSFLYIEVINDLTIQSFMSGETIPFCGKEYFEKMISTFMVFHSAE